MGGGGVARSSKPIASTVVGDPTLQVVLAERPLIEEHLHDAEHLGVRKEGNYLLSTEAEGSAGDGRYQVSWKRAKDVGAAGCGRQKEVAASSKAHVVRW